MTARNPSDAPEPGFTARAVKATVVIACGVVPAVALAMVIVADVRDGTGPASDALWFGAVASAVFLLPVGLYAALIRRKGFVIVLGVCLLATEAYSVWFAFTDDSSTAGLALLTVPFLGVPLVLLGALLQAWTRLDP